MNWMKGLTPGRRLALGAAIAALAAGVAVAVFSGNGGKGAHRHGRGANDSLGAVLAQPGELPPPPRGSSKPRGGAPSRAKPGTGGTSTGRPGSGARPARPALLLVAARYLGVSAPTVRRELAAGHTLAQIAAATPGRSAAGLVDVLVAARVAAIRSAAAEGRLSKDVETRRLSRVRKVIAAAVAHGRAASPVAFPLRQAAAYLGLRVKQLRDELRKGRTLAQIADTTRGRSANGLVDALVASRRAVLDRWVKAGTLKRANEQSMLATYRAWLTIRLRRAR
jgi:hypothetical protein